jgi:hypothetical protein
MKEQDPETTPLAISARRFSRRTAITFVAGTAASSLLHSREAGSLPARDQAAVDAKYSNVIRKYGHRLSPAQRVRAREILLRHQQMLKRVRDFALENGDAPATGLRLYPGDAAERRD